MLKYLNLFYKDLNKNDNIMVLEQFLINIIIKK